MYIMGRVGGRGRRREGEGVGKGEEESFFHEKYKI